MIISKKILFTLVNALIISHVAIAQPTDYTIKTPLGELKGIKDLSKGVLEFKGIQYATADRFSSAVPTLAWRGVKDATQFGSNCPQSARFNLTEQSLNEDCLYLNVSMPADIKPGEKLPVMLWIPGGGFVGGGSNLYKLDYLAHNGRIVVVSINYRLGLFGFMPHPAMNPDTNGDLGLEDQRIAMRWVKNNISAFGGDPKNVTIAGESAGAGSICQHLASSDKVSDLFHKAILVSAACMQDLPTLNQAMATPIWRSVANNPKDPNRRFRCPVPGDADYTDEKSLTCLKKQSVADLLEAQTYEAGNSILSFVPVTGNKVVPQSFSTAVANGAVMKVPMLMGGAQNELRLYVAYDVLGDNANHKKYPVNLQNTIDYYMPAFYGVNKELNQKILTHYFGSFDNPKNLNGATLGSMLSDFNPHVGINNCYYLRTSNIINSVSGMPAIYQYEFADPHAPALGVGIAKGSNPGFALGAVHSSILNYFFPNLSNTAAIDAPDLSPASQNLGLQMIAYFSSFMNHGKPSAKGNPKWPEYEGNKQNPSSNRVMRFSPNNIHLYNSYGGVDPKAKKAHQCAFWNTVYPE